MTVSRRHIAGALWVLAVLAGGPAAWGQSTAAESSQASGPEKLLAMSDRLLDEAQRQHMVNHRMTVVIDRFLALVKDLQSNDVMKEAKGQELERIAAILRVLSVRHVPSAARYLEEARKSLLAMLPNLNGAEKEIDIILRELERLLRQVSSGSAVEDLLSELKLIIEKEKKVHKDTRQWGAMLYQDAAQAEPLGDQASRTQDQIARTAARFQTRLKEAAEKETDPLVRPRMKKADELMTSSRAEPLLREAAQDIKTKQAVTAVQKQVEALKALEEVAKLLQADDMSGFVDALRDLRDKLDKLLKDQKELRQEAETTVKEKFAEKSKEVQVRQRDLGGRLQEARTAAPEDTAEPVKTHMASAQEHMSQAEQQAAKTQQEPSVDSQKKAEKSLEGAITELDKQIAEAEKAMEQSAETPDLTDLATRARDLAEKQRQLREQTEATKPQEVAKHAPKQAELQQEAQKLSQDAPLMPQLQQADQAMQQARENLKNTQQKQAIENQKKAENALLDAAKALDAAQQAMDLAGQQMELMQQTAQAQPQDLGQLAQPQTNLQQQAQQMAQQPAAKAMEQAAKNLEQGQQAQALENQQAAVDALVQSAQEMAPGVAPEQASEQGQEQGQQPGMEPGQQPGQPGQPEPGQQPGPPSPVPGIPTPNARTNHPREIGDRNFGGTPGGQAKDKGDGRWKAFSDRDRGTLYQKYANELPLEYRQLLKEYYEKLSK